MIGCLTPVWNYDGFGNGGLCPIKDFYHKILYTDTHTLVTWLRSGCSHLCPVAKCPMVMWSQLAMLSANLSRKLMGKPVGKAANYYCLPTGLPFISGGWMKEVLATAEIQECMEPQIPNPCREPQRGRERRTSNSGSAWTLASEIQECLEPQIPLSLPLQTTFRGRERLSALCLTSQNPIIQRPNSSTVTWAQLPLCSMT